MRSVLAIGAHPDDVELGCGATLLAHAAAGDTVTVLVVTGGEAGPGEPARRLEQEAAARMLGARLVWGGLHDCLLTADASLVGGVARGVGAAGAGLGYLHPPPHTHP
ncbi:PIG-L deacetylase family protein, partial [Trujillonella humicola]|uniref:PIG-L deacetylase family protein n=1 Tax=Trujillonella humicola TaxID=3383699 RepID=UPI00390666FE